MVIPKSARKVAKYISAGRDVTVEPIDEWSVKVTAKLSMDEWLAKTAGIGKGLWGKDSTKYIRKLREESDRKF